MAGVKILHSYQDMERFFTPYGKVNLSSNESNHSLLVLTGGNDVDPRIYGESSIHPYTQPPDPERDTREIEEVMYAWAEGIPVVGICRGAQLLCALHGGFLVQDMEGHAGREHSIVTENAAMVVNSTHHQMMVPSGHFEWVAWRSQISSFYHDGLGQEIPREYLYRDSYNRVIEPEAIWWPETQSLAIQWHPEWLEYGHPGRRFVMDFISKRVKGNE